MNHCLKPDIWNRFLDGSLSPAEGAAAESHLSACSQCRLVATEFVHVEEVLAGAAQEACRRAAMEPAEIRTALDRFRGRLHEPRGIACCVDALGFFLSAMLGASAGSKVMRSAARQAEITEARWPDFIARLSVMISDLCGEGAGAIVTYIGKLAEPETA